MIHDGGSGTSQQWAHEQGQSHIAADEQTMISRKAKEIEAKRKTKRDAKKDPDA